MYKKIVTIMYSGFVTILNVNSEVFILVIPSSNRELPRDLRLTLNWRLKTWVPISMPIHLVNRQFSMQSALLEMSQKLWSFCLISSRIVNLEK